ncbi:MAG TPA: cupin domain-containing protein [Rhizomicrobium sp.]
MPKIDIQTVPERRGSGYPAPFHLPAGARVRKALGDAGRLSDFGVNLLHLPPGAWSSQRHWHSAEDEFVYVLSGEVTLVSDRGEEILRAGDCAAFPKGAPDGHHLINKSAAAVTVLEIGTRATNDDCDYPDIDMIFESRVGKYTHRDGTSYPERDPSA